MSETPTLMTAKDQAYEDAMAASRNVEAQRNALDAAKGKEAAAWKMYKRAALEEAREIARSAKATK